MEYYSVTKRNYTKGVTLKTVILKEDTQKSIYTIKISFIESQKMQAKLHRKQVSSCLVTEDGRKAYREELK